MGSFSCYIKLCYISSFVVFNINLVTLSSAHRHHNLLIILNSKTNRKSSHKSNKLFLFSNYRKTLNYIWFTQRKGKFINIGEQTEKEESFGNGGSVTLIKQEKCILHEQKASRSLSSCLHIS